ncbi:hypothetical protein SKAU_G00074300 [Synaphobranchus kaupii]|uniref:Uncharacterized protein n=1 Tax=Synaphobranchus kaupii TaxID=118154 RepID=A0A9Q1G8Z3_SYNKA|nr:hypothetical protein SKAU_G00074300 [Synaphobranchus kaupii]
MVYDDTSKKWVPIKPGQQGFSRINIYHKHCQQQPFVWWASKLQDQQVVIKLLHSERPESTTRQRPPSISGAMPGRYMVSTLPARRRPLRFSNAMLFSLNVLNTQEGVRLLVQARGVHGHAPCVPMGGAQRASRPLPQIDDRRVHLYPCDGTPVARYTGPTVFLRYSCSSQGRQAEGIRHGAHSGPSAD